MVIMVTSEQYKKTIENTKSNSVLNMPKKYTLQFPLMRLKSAF